MILRNSAWEWPNHDLALSGEVCWTKVVAVNDSRIRANAAVHMVRKCNSENCPLSLLCWGLKMRSTKGKVTSDSHDNDSDGVGMNTSLCTVENWQTSAHLQVLAGATRWILSDTTCRECLCSIAQHSTFSTLAMLVKSGFMDGCGTRWGPEQPFLLFYWQC